MKFAPLGCTYFGGNQNYLVDVSIRRQFWYFLFFERFLTPIFEIKIENKGENIEDGTIGCYIAECDNPNTRFIIEEKYFVNFQNFRFINFEKGNTLKYKPKVNSDFIKQNGRYAVRFIVNRHVPYEKSHYEEIKEKYGENVKITITELETPLLVFSANATKTWETVQIPTPISGNASSVETSKFRITEGTLDELVKKHPDWKKPKVGKQGIPIGDYRWNRIVAVYPLNYLIALIGLFITIVTLIHPDFMGFIDYIYSTLINMHGEVVELFHS